MSNTALNLGIGLARKGMRVLVINNDPQSSLTVALGFQNPAGLEYTMTTVLNHVIDEEEFDPRECILHHKEGVDLLPSNATLNSVETALLNVMGGETILAEYIEMIRDDYDFIIIDCSPNLGMLTLNALAAGDEVIIPVQAAYLPVKGLELLLKTIARVQKKINKKLKIRGILITMVDYRTNYAKDITDTAPCMDGTEVTHVVNGVTYSGYCRKYHNEEADKPENTSENVPYEYRSKFI